MIELTREVRFTLSEADSETVGNSWSGSHALSYIAPHIGLQCTVRGELEDESSYVCNIKTIDQLVRKNVVSKIGQELSRFHCPEAILEFAREEITLELPSRLELVRLVCKTSPFVRFTWEQNMPNMISVTEQFEFSASHRLHNPELSDERNQDLFGKCNHPNGHGHNYLVDVTVARTNGNNESFDQLTMQQTVKSKVIDRLDHKHLNKDIDIFQTLNPTVENIAQTIFDWLRDEVQPLVLRSIRVYETPKTWAEVSN